MAKTETELVNLHYRNYLFMAFTIYYCQKQVVSSKNNQKHETYQKSD